MNALQHEEPSHHDHHHHHTILNRSSVPHLLSLLSSALRRPSHDPHPHPAPRARPPSPPAAARLGLAFDLLLNPRLPYRYTTDDDDDDRSPLSASSSHHLTRLPDGHDEREEQERRLPSSASTSLPPPPRSVRVRDELTTFLFLLRAHGHYERANAVQLLVSRLRGQSQMTVPSSILSPLSSASPPSATATLPFKSASAVIVLLLELTGAALSWSALQAPLLRDLHRAYDDPSLASSFVLPQPDPSLPTSDVDPMCSALEAYDLGWTREKKELAPLVAAISSFPLEGEGESWLIDKRLSAPLDLSRSANVHSVQQVVTQRPALFSFQKGGEGQPVPSEDDEWLTSLTSVAALPKPSLFLDVALSHAADDERRHGTYERRELRRHWAAHRDGAQFARAWRTHRENLLRSSSPEPVAGEDTVWQRVSACPPSSPAVASSLLDSFAWGADAGAVPFSRASLSMFSHPQLFEPQYAATRSSVFTPTVSADLWRVEDDIVRASLLVMQAIPSTLYSFSSFSSEFTPDPSSAARPPRSWSRIVHDCALTGTRLHRLERLAGQLSARGLISQGLGSSLLLFSAYFKQQVASLPEVARERRQSSAASYPLTLLELHCHAQSLQQHISWLYDVLLQPFSSPSTAAVVSSALCPGTELLSYLYGQCLVLPCDSPFFTTLTSLFEAALAPFLLTLRAFVYHGHLHDPHHELFSHSAAAPLLLLPAFLEGEQERIVAAGRLLRLLSAAAGEWTECCDDCGVPVLQVAYSGRDVERTRTWRAALQAQQEAHLSALMQEEERKVCAVREAAAAKRRAAAAAAARWRVEAAEDEDDTQREKRRLQMEYQRQLDLQLEDKARRQREEDEKERQEREDDARRLREERRIIDEEKERLEALITAAEQGKTALELRREVWRTRRRERAGPLTELIHAEHAEWARQVNATDGASAPPTATEAERHDVDGGSDSGDTEVSDADYHTDDEEDSPRSQSHSQSQASSPSPRAAAERFTTKHRRVFTFDYESPAAAASPSPSLTTRRFFSPSPRHAATDTDDSIPPTLSASAFHVPSPRAGSSAASADEAKVEEGVGQDRDIGRRFAFNVVPSPRSGVDSGASSSPMTSPRHQRHVSSDSLSSALASASDRATPRARAQSAAHARADNQRAPDPETNVGGGKEEVKQVEKDEGQYDWNEEFDWATAVTREEADEAREALKYGDDGDQGWSDEEAQDAKLRALPEDSATSDGDDVDDKRVHALHAERERSRALNRQRNTVSGVTFASAEGSTEGSGDQAQAELIHLMDAKEAQRASNEARGLARERNERSRVFTDEGPSTARREESSQLMANRQRMMASSVFPESSDSGRELLRVREDVEPSQPPKDVPPPAASSPAVLEESGNEQQRVPPQANGEEAPEVKQAHAPRDAAPQPHVEAATLSFLLPLDVAIRSSLLPALRQQCAMIDRVTLSFFLHALRIESHLQSLHHFFLMKAGDVLDAFTSSLFADLRRRPFIPLTPPAILDHWHHAVELCPTSASASLSLHPSLVTFAVSSSLPAPSFSRVEGMEDVDQVRMEYRVEHPASVVVSEEVVGQYGRVFSLLLRVLWVRSEMRELFLWMRTQDADIRRMETRHQRTVSRAMPSAVGSSAASAASRGKQSAAIDDLFLLSPTKRRGASGSFALSAARDDDVFHRARAEVADARLELERLVEARWRLRWLHAVRAEMTHVLSSIHHHLHIAVIATRSSNLFALFHSGSLTSLAQVQSAHAAFLSSLLVSTFVDSASPVASLLEATLCSVLTFAQSLSPLTLHSPVQAERWQGVRDVCMQFRSHSLFLTRVLRVVREEGRGDTTVAGLEVCLDFNLFHTRLRQRELEATVLRPA